MTAKHDRDDFSAPVRDALSRRASFICSNPDCRSMTLAPSTASAEKYIYVGVAAHLTAAAPGGPRYDPTLTSGQREAIHNAIFLCSACAMMVDKNNGADFPLSVLQRWKADHEEWVRQNLNRRPDSSAVGAVTVGPNLVHNGSVIVTQNQLGGQVAHSITNIGPQPRRVSAETLEVLISQLRLHPPEEVDFLVANESEAKNLAAVIKAALAAAGWTFATDVLALAPTGTGVIVAVPRGEEEKATWQVLGTWLTRASLGFQGERLGPDKKRAMLYIALNPI